MNIEDSEVAAVYHFLHAPVETLGILHRCLSVIMLDREATASSTRKTLEWMQQNNPTLRIHDAEVVTAATTSAPFVPAETLGQIRHHRRRRTPGLPVEPALQVEEMVAPPPSPPEAEVEGIEEITPTPTAST